MPNMPLMPNQPFKLVCEDIDGIHETTSRNGLEFQEWIEGPTRLKETTQKMWMVDLKTWIYFAVDANKYPNMTQNQFIKEAKEKLMEKIQKQFDDFV